MFSETVEVRLRDGGLLRIYAYFKHVDEQFDVNGQKVTQYDKK